MAKISARNAQPITKVRATRVYADVPDVAYRYLFVVTSDGRVLCRCTSPNTAYKVFDKVNPADHGATSGPNGRARFSTLDAPRLQSLLARGLERMGYTNVRPA